MKFLGIDYGKRKVGLAISEGEQSAPLYVINVAGLKDAVLKVKNIIEKENIDVVVIGTPEGGESLKIVNTFIFEFKRVLPFKQIVKIDETLTSKQALAEMVELNKSQKKRREEDAYSAAILLQNYLDLIK